MMKMRLAAAIPLAIRLALALVVAKPVTCQDDDPAYFNITSVQSFGSQDKPSINLTGTGLSSVQIRVYRIHDAIQFFSQLDGAHNFSDHPPALGRKHTFIERVHEWKRGLRRSIRLNLRGQFTESPRQHFASWFPKKSKSIGNSATYYAETPVLNRDQLVLSFVQPVGRERWASTEVPIPVKGKGLYVVEAVHGKLRAYTVLSVSDLVLLTRSDGAREIGWTVDRATGEPVADAKVTTLVHRQEPASTTTGLDGLAELSAVKTVLDEVQIVAQHGTDVAFTSAAPWSSDSKNRAWTGYVYTDRPVYRPGDPIHFRAIVRQQAAPAGYAAPTAQEFSVQITGPDGKTIYDNTLTTNSLGVLHGDLTLLKTSALGYYFVAIKTGQAEMAGNFEVQEYKKPEYEVRITPAKPHILEGEEINATIDSRYYFGEPVAGAKVHYSLSRTQYWPPFWEEADADNAPQGEGDQFEDASGNKILEADGQLDADGKLNVTIPTTVSDHQLDYRYRLDADVTDKAGRAISGSGSIIASYGTFAINIEAETYVAKPSETARFKLEARDYDNHPVSTEAAVELVTWDWREHQAVRTLASTSAHTDADGVGTAELTMPAAGGSFRVMMKAAAPGGRTVESSTWVWVSGAGKSFWGGNGQQSVQIVPDKKKYQPGDDATLLILTAHPNTPVLVCVEGGSIRSHQVLRSADSSVEFHYKVTRDDEPGFFVSAQFVRNGKLFAGQKHVKVPPIDHTLQVAVSTDKAQYLPGQSATYRIAATTPDGKPAANADFSLGVVDEAIYAIRRDSTPDIVESFFGNQWDSTSAANSLNYYFTGEAGTRRMRLADLRRPSQLAQLKPEPLIRPKIRKAFPDTAFWAADITTDAMGKAETQVTFPDSLTTWRATIRGLAPGDRFGAATSKTIIRKNLIVRLAVPRFFVQGDEVVISEIVHNYLETVKHARVEVHMDGLDILTGAATQEIDIPVRGEAKIDWRVRVRQVAAAKITAEALTNEESDALESALPIHPPGVPQRQSKSGSLAGTGAAQFSLAFPSDAVPASRSISIHVSPSAAGAIFGALEYLTSFPYGCVEQTMSSFLPDIMVARASTELHVNAPLNRDDLKAKIQAGLDRLYSFQHDDGGWGWWQTDATHPFMTAYVIAGFVEARTAGVQIDENAFKRGVTWLQRHVAGSEDAPDLRAYIEYTLAMAALPDAAAMNRSYSARSDLSPYGLALLGLALENQKDSRASQVAQLLVKNAQQNDAEAWWIAKRDQMLDFDADVSPEATAYAMKFLSHEQAGSPLLPKAALWLVNHRDEGPWWSSTKQTAMVIYGLLDYLKTSNELHPDLTATVRVNGQVVVTERFNGDKLTGTELALDEGKLQQSSNSISVESNGQGRLYYSVTAQHNSNQAHFEKEGAIALNLLRDYYRLRPTKRGEAIVYDPVSLEGAVQQGDVLAVRLTVTGTAWKYLLVEDPIPAGTEFIERDEKYRLSERPPWWRYWFTRRELHDDRLAIFQTEFSEGQMQYFYLLRVVNPGIFHVSPARVQPMYEPEHQATTEARSLEVQ